MKRVRLVLLLAASACLLAPGLASASGVLATPLTAPTLAASQLTGATSPPPIPDCFAEAGYCIGIFLKSPMGPTQLTGSPDGVYTLEGPTGIDTTHPVACGDAGCLYNHFNWSMAGASVLEGCDANNPHCKVKITQNSSSWAPVEVALNDYPNKVWVLWSTTSRKISGTIKNAFGKPSSGTTVTMTDSSGGGGGSATSGADGTYSATVPPGTYKVTPHGSTGSTYQPASTTVTVVASDATGVDFTRHDPVTISGTVLGVGNHGGQAGVTVKAVGTNGGSGSATTGADGTYSMSVDADTYVVTPSAGDATLQPSTLAVDASGGDAQANFSLGYEVSGYVTQTRCGGGCHFDPTPDVALTADPKNGGDGATATSGADGTFSMLLGPGDYELTPSQDDVAFNPESRDISVHARIELLNFNRCADAPDGTPAAAARLRQASPCHPDGIDWAMPDRLTPASVAKWSSDEGLPTRGFVYPNSWTVKLFTTDDLKPLACTSDVKYEWEVDKKKLPAGAKVLQKPADGCETQMKVSRLGNYVVTATKYQKVKGKWMKSGLDPFKKTVVVRDWVVTAMGDSNGSGEGNRPFFFTQCNRSIASYQFQSALYLEQHDPHSSVTFLFASCSGARIEHLYKLKYEGINEGRPLSPQINQIDFLLAKREADNFAEPERTPDAAIVSIGINNLGFGPLLSFCSKNRILHPLTDCPDLDATTKLDGTGGVDSYNVGGPQTMRAQLNLRLRGLFATYHDLAAQLRKGLSPSASLGGFGPMPASHLLLTQYPDFSHDDDGNTCDTYNTESVVAWSPVTWGWIGAAAANLDATVLRAASRYGWSGVTLNQVPFLHHGYCAADSFFVSLSSGLIHGNKAGAFHPNATAHKVTAQGVIPRLCTSLYGNAECDGIVKYGAKKK